MQTSIFLNRSAFQPTTAAADASLAESLAAGLTPAEVRSFNATQKMLRLIPAYTPSTITVPYVSGSSMDENLDALHIEVQLPDYCWGQIEQGQPYGKITISINDYLLQEIPLVADRSLKKATVFSAASDFILSRIFVMSK